MNGEAETGVTIHFMDESFDTGDIIAQKPYHIHSKATMGTIFNELNVLGIELLLQVLQAYEIQELPRIPQPIGDFISGKGLSERDTYINYNQKRVGFIALVNSIHGNFYEIDMGVKKEYQGLGIGTQALSLLKRIVQKNNINIEIQVKNVNYAAIKTVLKNGFVLARQDKLYSYFSIDSKSIK